MIRAIAFVLLCAIVALLALSVLKHQRQARQRESIAAMTPDRRYARAMELYDSGVRDRAIDEMELLARIRPPYLPAHEFLSSWIIASEAHLSDEKVMDKLIGHLAAMAEGGEVAAYLALAHVSTAGGGSARAASVLSEAAANHPELHWPLAQMLAAADRNEAAAAAAEQAVAYFRARLVESDGDLTTQLELAAALTQLGRHDEATSVLEAAANENPKQAEKIKTRVNSSRWRAAEDWLARGNDAKAVDALTKLLDTESHGIAAWDRLDQWQRSESDSSQLAAAAIRDSLAGGEAPGMLDFVKGVRAYREGRVDEAIESLESALETQPGADRVRHNLAWYLANGHPPQFERAIQLCDSLVRSHPKNVAYRQTRGQIHALAGNNDAAIADLEAARVDMPNYPPLTQTLSALYEQRGERTAPHSAPAAKSPADHDNLITSE